MSVTAERYDIDRHVEREACVECGHPHFVPARFRRVVVGAVKLSPGYYEPCPQPEDCRCLFRGGE